MPEEQEQSNLDALASAVTKDVRAERTQRRMEELRLKEDGSVMSGLRGVQDRNNPSGPVSRRPRSLLELIVRSLLDLAYMFSPQRRKRQKVLKEFEEKRKKRTNR
jgi:hypothetical protein